MCDVSIILPTHNRARFLPEAFEAIDSQTYTDWKLFVVDDGSTDDTRDLVARFAERVEQRVFYIHQENAGAYAARNTGLKHVRERYIAFYDSDDLWLPYHLQRCYTALETHSDVDWVFGDLSRINADSGEVIEASNFFPGGVPRPFTALEVDKRDRLCVLTDPAVLTAAIDSGIPAGLHSSLIRRSVFDSYRFSENYRNGQDRFAVIEALAQRRKMAYFTATHLIYRIHEANDSLARSENDISRRLQITTSLIEQYKNLRGDKRLSREELRAVDRRIARELFWGVGHHVYWVNCDAASALAMYLRGIAYDPLRLQYWKSLGAAIVKSPAVMLSNSRNPISK